MHKGALKYKGKHLGRGSLLVPPAITARLQDLFLKPPSSFTYSTPIPLSGQTYGLKSLSIRELEKEKNESTDYILKLQLCLQD